MEKTLIECINYYEDLIYNNEDSFKSHFNINGDIISISFTSDQLIIVFLADNIENGPTPKITQAISDFFNWTKGINK